MTLMTLPLDVNPLRWARVAIFFSRERPSLSDGLGRQARIRPRGRGLAAGQLVIKGGLLTGGR